MDPNVFILLIGLCYVVGVLLRIFGSYWIAWANDPEIVWDWRKVGGLLAGGLLGLVPTLASAAFLSQLQDYASLGLLGYFTALLAGLGASSAGREAWKVPAAYSALKNRG